eukprot:CAMPEP_0201537962 /NCGR_PEP_ID=MMETSP0161_2-20130828/66245_1 /ASSEMBLY_ACC=CAM_ASM_000251 /TAXON_ID=180227 /ORGANISM="Neoparamoeba aestuarina, Strain SoJaBio B1-5/56/2" /LENGTH=453 /DNA_ID=CAMNT_0047944551 /DNA_START=507 /DNA_END=1865 /DNA_ORIENTATION=+
MNYYHLGNQKGRMAIRDPDERLAREVFSTTRRLANIVSTHITSLPRVFFFTFLLWKDRGGKMAFLPHLWLLVAYEIAQRIFPKNIGQLYRDQAIAQSLYSKAATRTIQTHSESISALGGAPLEKQILDKKFAGVMKAASELHYTNSLFGLIFKLAYINGSQLWLLPATLLPLLFRQGGAVLNPSQAISHTRYTFQVMLEMLIANGSLLTNHAQTKHMTHTSKRLCDMIDVLTTMNKKADTHREENMIEGDVIAFENVGVTTPTGVKLLDDLSFRVERGQNLLLTGRNGAGKSSIFRCLGGLWPVVGKITKPGAAQSGLHADIYYLPQKPYNVLGSVSDNLAYPLTPEEAGLREERMKEVLQQVNLLYLLDVEKKFEQEKKTGGRRGSIHWTESLSLGEQQRLAIARLFFHQPKFCILDECTSALPESMEILLYDMCRANDLTYITICHRPALQ